MFKNLISVGGLTLVSRATGFLRDIVVAAILGAGAINDAFVVAFRLPNQLRAIFGEGAFNSAYVPSYSRVLERNGRRAAGGFASQIFTILLASQVVLLVVAEIYAPGLVRLLAPGFDRDPVKMAHAVEMTRITFPYLLCITLVTLQSGTLNANRMFTASALAPVLLNIVMILFLAVAWLFPNAGIAASVGVTVSGVAQLVMMVIAARRAGVLERLVRPTWNADVRQFFRALGPAVIGSAGVQIAIFADTIISSLLPTGGPSSIYFADRIYQFPVGVIGIAAGTVLLPEMSRFFAGGNAEGAFQAQNRTMALTLALSTPFFIAFILIPDEIMRGVFLRGQFTAEAAANSAAVLAAYGFGLLPIVLIRSAVAGFQARGNTTTPMLASLLAVGCNLLLKIVLYKPLGAVGLATATAFGAWINLLALSGFGWVQGVVKPDDMLARVAVAVDIAAFVLASFVFIAEAFITALVAGHRFANEMHLVLLSAGGGLVYGLVLVLALRVMGVNLARPRRSQPARAKAAV